MISVTTPAASTQLTTLSSVKAMLSITDTDSDDYLSMLVDQASSAVVSYCNRVFARETVTEMIRLVRGTFDRPMPGKDHITLTRWPMDSITALSEDATALVANVDYEYDPDQGRVWRLDTSGNRKTWTGSLIVVSYTGGWRLPNDTGRNLPAEVEDATMRMVKSRWMERRRDPLVKAQDVPGGGRTEYWIPASGSDGNMSPDVRDILDNYRALMFA